MELHQTVCAQGHDAVLANRHTQRRQRTEQRTVGGRNVPALYLTQAIGKEAQGALGGERGVELTHRTGGGVTWVDEGFLIGGELPFVQRLEVIAAHVDLAANLDDLGGHAFEPQRNLVDRADVLRDVLAGFAVATRGGLHQHAALVAQVDGQAVELQFGRVLDGRIGFAKRQLAAHTGIESQRAGRLGVGLGADAQHRHRVPYRLEASKHLADDTLGG